MKIGFNHQLLQVGNYSFH